MMNRVIDKTKKVVDHLTYIIICFSQNEDDVYNYFG